MRNTPHYGVDFNPMPISLFDVKLELVREVRAAFAEGHQTVILQSPTGAGKSRMGAYMAAGALGKGVTVLFDVPLKELWKQYSNTLRELVFEHGHIVSSEKYNSLLKN